MVWAILFRFYPVFPVQASHLCPTLFSASGEYVSPLHPEHHSVSDGHDKAYNIPFHPVKRRKNCRRGQKLHSPVPAEIRVSDVSSRKQGPTGWHWRLLLAILHNNRESSYRWRNKKCILYLYSSAERNEGLSSHGSDRLFCCHRD